MSPGLNEEFLDLDADGMAAFAERRAREQNLTLSTAHLPPVVETLLALKDHARLFLARAATPAGTKTP